MSRQFWVYIMASDSGTLYVGVTGNLLQGVHQHKTNAIKGFTQKYSCHKLIYFEEYKNILEAIAREKQLKRWRREKKEALIRKKNRLWNDLIC